MSTSTFHTDTQLNSQQWTSGKLYQRSLKWVCWVDGALYNSTADFTANSHETKGQKVKQVLYLTGIKFEISQDPTDEKMLLR